MPMQGREVVVVFACSPSFFQMALECFVSEQRQLGHPVGEMVTFFMQANGGGGATNLIQPTLPPEAHKLIDHVVLIGHDECRYGSREALMRNTETLRQAFPEAAVFAYWVEIQDVDPAEFPPGAIQNWRLN